MGTSGMFGGAPPVAPQVVNTAAQAAATQTTNALATQTVPNATTAVPMSGQISTPVTLTAGTVVPATEGMAAAGVVGDSGSLAGVTAESLEGTSITGSGVGMSGASVGGAVLPGVGAGVLAGQLGKSGTGQDIGKALMFNHGGEKENAAVAGMTDMSFKWSSCVANESPKGAKSPNWNVLTIEFPSKVLPYSRRSIYPVSMNP